jgi:nicotinamide-nucleotide amidase
LKATIVTIGDELLIGQIVDTTSGYIATEILSISDDKQHILDTLAYLQNKVQLVIITGGLGPTKDDITKHTFCEYFQDHLVRNESIEKHVIELIESALKRPASQMNKDQALVPSSATILFNKVGTAPGMWIQKENTVFVSLPGVPYEMKHIMENAIIPKVITDFKRPFIIHKTILTYGQGESLVAERIEDWESNLPEFIKLAYLPAPGRVRLRLTARGIDKEYLQDAIDGKVETLTKILKDIIVGYNDSETIEVILGQVLTKNNQTLATAESCTGGKLAQLITSIAGASAYFRGSVVTYATDTKISTLGVSLETIKEHSVVSLQVAKEMALGVQKLMKSDFAIATTGNAGPSKGDENANLGVVCIAIATPNGVFAEEFSFGQPREKVIDRTVNKAFEMVLKEILKNV